jgi:hypothetical protein
MKLERSNGILFVGCRKDNLRQALNPDRLKDSEPVHLRHLHVEKNNIGVLLPDHSDGLFAVTAFTDNLDIVIVL